MKSARAGERTFHSSVPYGILILLLCLSFLAIKGILDGITFLIDPNGIWMRITELEKDKFRMEDFTLVGVFLIIFYGFLSIVALIGMISKMSFLFKNLPSKNYKLHWSWWVNLLIGLFLVLSNGAQLILVNRLLPLQLMLTLVGLGMLILLQTTYIKKYLSSERNASLKNLHHTSTNWLHRTTW